MLGSVAITKGKVEAFDFRFSQGTLSHFDMLDSATAPPGRYVWEVARRTLALAPGADAVVISNPLVAVRGNRLLPMLQGGGTLKCPSVVTDERTFPVAYVLPRSLFDQGLGRFLCLLSAAHAAADAQLLSVLTGQVVPRRKGPLKSVLPLPKITGQGYILDDNLEAWLAQCTEAVRLIRARPGDWRTLPFAAHHPNHAGDVLFFSLASRLVPKGALAFERQVVCRDYLDIFHDCGNRLDPIALDMPPVSRNGDMSDGRYFINSLARLDPAVRAGTFQVYCRFSKSYTRMPFNLVDQARFALGDPVARFEDTLYRRAPVVSSRCARPAQPLRVLMQLTGGWPLKTYPDQQRRVLTRALLELGCQVTVLEAPEGDTAGAQVAKGGSTERLSALIADHHVVVSVDSFPLHFASQVLGHPTVAVFGPTFPGHSDAARRPGYRLPVPLLPCGPCGGYKVCPLTQAPECGNFPHPADLVAAIMDLALEAYGLAAVA
ncbi:MAG: glycosyltransferase family 9 protein [Azospirillaceae bacterium]|nr:glycosyltransferase family 9 protein [Azospirillaceae bacterium]